MSEYDTSLAGLLQLNDQNLADIFPNDVLDEAPLVAAMVAVAASNGTLHKYLRRSTAGSAGFRAIEVHSCEF